jgi:hypothetical protein
MSRGLATKRPITPRTLGQCLRPVPVEVPRGPTIWPQSFPHSGATPYQWASFWTRGRRWPDNSSWCQARYSLMRFRLQIPAAATRCNLWLMLYAARPFLATSPMCFAQKLGKGICVVRLPNSFGSRPPISAEINATIPASGVTATGYVITEFRADGKVSIWLPRLRSSPTLQVLTARGKPWCSISRG